MAEPPAEFWNQYKVDFAPGTHVRIYPLLDWTELNVREYLARRAQDREDGGGLETLRGGQGRFTPALLPAAR